MARLNLRSNAESVHYYLDRRFGGLLNSKSDMAIINEILARCLIHNLCCWSRMCCLFGLVPEFGDDVILPFETPPLAS